jgi:beta-lactamase regulating signal transducer with metallopeptidase domain
MDAVLNWIWQGSVVAAASGVMLVALQRARANVRYTVCWAALLLIVALPLLPPIPSTAPATEALLPTQTDAIVSLPDAWWTSTLVILAAWMVWASIQFVKFVSAIIAIRRARARSRPFPSHLQSILPHWHRLRFEGRPAAVVLSNSVTSAAVLGWGAPMIAVAPSLVRALDPTDLDRVLIHEWAHVQRHDDVLNILQIVVRMVAGWHPGLWWIDRRLHVEREIACDEVTVAITGSPKSYAECLMKLSRLKGTRGATQAAPAIFTPSGLRGRVVNIVSTHRVIPPVWSRTLAAAIVLVLFLMSVAVGGLTLVEAAVLARPLVSARTVALSIASDRPVPAARPVSSNAKTEDSPRRTSSRIPSPRRPKTEQPSPVPQSAVEPTAPAAPRSSTTVDSTRADAEPLPPVASEAASVPYLAKASPAGTEESSDVSAAQPRSPWSAAAAGGTALGRKSKNAGVATAGVFTRFARRVAGSF